MKAAVEYFYGNSAFPLYERFQKVSSRILEEETKNLNNFSYC